MGISWTGMHAAGIKVALVDQSDTNHPVWDHDGPRDAPVLVLAYGDDGGHATEVTGTLDELAALARRIHNSVRAAQHKAGRATHTCAGRQVTIETPDGQPYSFRLDGDDAAVVRIDGQPAVGIDAHGPGHWPDGGTWERPATGGTVTGRSVTVFAMSEEQYRGLAPHLGLPEHWFGRWKGAPGELRTISLDNSACSCASDAGLDQAIAYIRDHGLTYEESRTIRYTP